MRLILTRPAAVLLALGLFPEPLSADTTASFLKIPVDARAVGMGGGIAAVTEGAAALAYNPAGLALTRFKEAAVLYAPHVQGMDLGYLSYGQATRFGALGMSHLMLRSGDLDGRDDDGRPTGRFSAADRALGVSIARPVKLGIPGVGPVALGLQAKYIHSRVGAFVASTYAMDIGAQASGSLGRLPARFGLAVRNLGPGLRLQERSDPLPSSLSLGAAFQPFGPVTVSVGGTRYLQGERHEFSVGTELAPVSNIFVRGNYGMVRSAGQVSQFLPLLSWGMGFRFARYQFDYAFMPLGELGSTQRLNFTMRFGAERQAPAFDRSAAQSGARKWLRQAGAIRDRSAAQSGARKAGAQADAIRGLAEAGRKPLRQGRNGYIESKLWFARQAMREGRYSVAAYRAAEALELDPRSVRALEILGSAYYMLGNRRQARIAWQQVLRLDAENKLVAAYLEKLR